MRQDFKRPGRRICDSDVRGGRFVPVLLPIAQIRECEPLAEADLKKLCRYVIDILIEESNVQAVCSPVIICGDIHGT